MQINVNMNNNMYNTYQAAGTNYRSKDHQDQQMQFIQEQIDRVQTQVQELAENEEMSVETKKEKQKELQQQMKDLNKQMMQRRVDMQKEKREKIAKDTEAAAKGNNKTKKSKEGTVSHSVMHGIIDAESTMKQAKSSESIKVRMEGQVRILGGEIRADASRGVYSESKTDRLTDLENRIDNLSADIVDKLSDVQIEDDSDQTKNDEKADEKENNIKTDENESKATGKHVDILL